MRGCENAKEMAKRLGNLDLEIGAGELGQLQVLIAIDDVISTKGCIIHSENWGRVEEAVDALAVDNSEGAEPKRATRRTPLICGSPPPNQDTRKECILIFSQVLLVPATPFTRLLLADWREFREWSRDRVLKSAGASL